MGRIDPDDIDLEQFDVSDYDGMVYRHPSGTGKVDFHKNVDTQIELMKANGYKLVEISHSTVVDQKEGEKHYDAMLLFEKK